MRKNVDFSRVLIFFLNKSFFSFVRVLCWTSYSVLSCLCRSMKKALPWFLIMASPIRSNSSPTVSRVTAILPNTTVLSPRSISNRSQLEESISTLQSKKNEFLFVFFDEKFDRSIQLFVSEEKNFRFSFLINDRSFLFDSFSSIKQRKRWKQ